jgi:hypothetical protein
MMPEFFAILILCMPAGQVVRRAVPRDFVAASDARGGQPSVGFCDVTAPFWAVNCIPKASGMTTGFGASDPTTPRVAVRPHMNDRALQHDSPATDAR